MRKEIQKIIFLFAVFFFTSTLEIEKVKEKKSWEPSIGEEEAKEVILRFIGNETTLNFEVHIDESMKSENEGDAFTYNYENGLLNITASSPVAICRGFYDFTKSNGAGVRTWSSKRFEMPETILVKSKTVRSHFRYHQYLNVVTFGYSTAFWDENRWDEELDWMALHGIDLPLMLLGSEQIYRRTFKDLYQISDEDLDEWETGPAHLPWFRMGNIAGNILDGPLGSNWFKRENEITHHILKRMSKLRIKPIVPAFGGFVPRAVAELLGNYTKAGWDWVPEEYKTYRLRPIEGGPFKEIGKRFIELWDEEYEKSYGEQFKYYLSDSFNEMKVPSDLDELTMYGDQIYQAIKEGSKNDDAVFVTQGWEFIWGYKKWTDGNTTWEKFKALTKNIPDHNFMVISMSPEYGGYGNKNWELYENFEGKDWINTMLPNMGGKNFWTGCLQDYAVTFPTTLMDSPGDKNCKGWGMTMEGIEYNELLYELIADMGWEPNRTKNVEDWLQNYGSSRFGKFFTSEVKEIYNAFHHTVYSVYQDDPVFSFDGYNKHDHYYEHGSINTTTEEFFSAIENFFETENINKLKNAIREKKKNLKKEGSNESLIPTLRVDAIEWSAFYACAKSEKNMARIVSEHEAGNKGKANRLLKELKKLFYDIDYALTAHPLFDEAKWEMKAANLADTEETKQKYIKNARRLLSVWYGIRGEELLFINDYSARTFAGQIRDYQFPRVYTELDNLINGKNHSLRDIERQYIPDSNDTANAPPLSSPKHFIEGRLVQGPGFTDETPDEELLDFLKQLIDEAKNFNHAKTLRYIGSLVLMLALLIC